MDELREGQPLDLLYRRCRSLRGAARKVVASQLTDLEPWSLERLGVELREVARGLRQLSGIVARLEAAGVEGWRLAAAPTLYKVRCLLEQSRWALEFDGLLPGEVAAVRRDGVVALVVELEMDDGTLATLSRGEAYLLLGVMAGGLAALEDVVAVGTRVMAKAGEPGEFVRPVDVQEMLGEAARELFHAQTTVFWAPDAEVAEPDMGAAADEVARRVAWVWDAAERVRRDGWGGGGIWMATQWGVLRVGRVVDAVRAAEALVGWVEPGAAGRKGEREVARGQLGDAASLLGVTCRWLSRRREAAPRRDLPPVDDMIEALDKLNRVWSDGQAGAWAAAMAATNAAERGGLLRDVGLGVRSLAGIVDRIGVETKGPRGADAVGELVRAAASWMVAAAEVLVQQGGPAVSGS